MICLVRQANSVVLEVDVDAKAKGQECLDKVCQMLGTIETDYFGLQYAGTHNEMLWLNMRNQIRRQLPGPQPYRLQLRVKFYVPAHLLLQDTTRHQFYLNLKQELLEGNLRTDSEQRIRLAALMVQAELGDYVCTNSPLMYINWYPEPSLRTWLDQVLLKSSNNRKAAPLEQDEHEQASCHPGEDGSKALEICEAIRDCHHTLNGYSSNKCKYMLIKEAAQLEDFGMEYYHVRSGEGDPLRLGVGPRGITVLSKSLEVKQRIPYGSIHIATHTGRCFFLSFVELNSSITDLAFKLDSCQAASAVYRAVTEKHAFHSCETVRNSVTSQFIRDLKGTILSLFNENSAMGKNYVFDIRRTCREVYDHTRRILYQIEAKKEPASQQSLENDFSSEDAERCCQNNQCKDFRKQLASLQDSILCRICMDSGVSTAFFPCRHVVCCDSCAVQCDQCPLCRTAVKEIQNIYLPINTEKLFSQTDPL